MLTERREPGQREKGARSEREGSQLRERKEPAQREKFNTFKQLFTSLSTDLSCSFSAHNSSKEGSSSFGHFLTISDLPLAFCNTLLTLLQDLATHFDFTSTFRKTFTKFGNS